MGFGYFLYKGTGTEKQSKMNELIEDGDKIGFSSSYSAPSEVLETLTKLKINASEFKEAFKLWANREFENKTTAEISQHRKRTEKIILQKTEIITVRNMCKRLMPILKRNLETDMNDMGKVDLEIAYGFLCSLKKLCDEAIKRNLLILIG